MRLNREGIKATTWLNPTEVYATAWEATVTLNRRNSDGTRKTDRLGISEVELRTLLEAIERAKASHSGSYRAGYHIGHRSPYTHSLVPIEPERVAVTVSE